MDQQNTINQAGENGFSQEQIITAPFDLLKRSFLVYRMGFWDLLKMLLIPVLGVIPFMVVVVLYGGTIYIFRDFTTARIITLAILGILAILAFVIMIYVGASAKVGMYKLIQNRLEDKDGSNAKSVKEIFNESKTYFWKFIIVSFLVGLFVMLWSFLFIIPGIIFVVYYSFSMWVLICENKESGAVLQRSKELVKNHWWEVAGRFVFLGLVYVVFIIVLSLPFSFVPKDSIAGGIWGSVTNIISFIASPLFLIYNYFIYKDLVAIKGDKN